MGSSDSYPNRSGTAKAVNFTGTLLMTFFAVWRLVVRFRINPRLGWSDYWIIVALVTALAGHTFFLISAFSGEGCVDADPYLTFERRNRVYFLQHFGGSLNMYAMFFAKLSICSYLLGLNFSRVYRRIIISSIVLVCICNFILPMLSHWAACKPVSARWDRSIKPADKKCWPYQVHMYITFIQSFTNVVTDVLYAAAPLIYLRKARFTKYTRWGVRIVFLAALVGTGISIAKPINFARLYKGTKNGLYISVTTTSLSTAENSVCIIVACLPPLRRTIDNLLQKILPYSFLERLGAVDTSPQKLSLTSYHSSESGATDGGYESSGEGTVGKYRGDDEFVQGPNGRIVRAMTVMMMGEKYGGSTEFGSHGQTSFHEVVE